MRNSSNLVIISGVVVVQKCFFFGAKQQALIYLKTSSGLIPCIINNEKYFAFKNLLETNSRFNLAVKFIGTLKNYSKEGGRNTKMAVAVSDFTFPKLIAKNDYDEKLTQDILEEWGVVEDDEEATD